MQKVSGTHKRLLIVCGPTATGKTKLAIELAKRYSGELVSADSRQVYKGLDVISGKDKQDLSGIPMWLYDVASPDRQFSVSLYRKIAIPVIDGILARGKLPIIVGGTGLYIQSLIASPETIDIPPDTTSRVRWNMISVVSLQKELRAINPKRFLSMNASDRKNPRRLIRALEIAAWQMKHTAHFKEPGSYDTFWIGILRDMGDLKKRITTRVRDRWDHGALEESKRYPAMSATGMAALTQYLNGSLTKGQAQALWVQEEVAYAKRQMTWFRRKAEIHWYDAGESGLVNRVVRDVDTWYT